MGFVTEQTIEKTMEAIQKGADIQEQWNAFAEEERDISEFLFSESFEILTKPERDYLLFLSLVIYKSAKVYFPDQKIYLDKIEKAEEQNWDLWSKIKTGSFKERLDPFFENTAQEDLLALIEDALFYDEDEILTKVGREPMFIALKTLVDVLTKP
jgi:hypothetical protein